MLIACVVTSAGCGVSRAQALRKDCAPLAETFFWESIDKQLIKFESYDLADQYRVYICGNQFIHPPAIHLSSALAKRGEEAVPFLTEKMRRAKDDLTIRDVINVFYEMQRLGSHDVANDEVLMRLAATKVDHMRAKGWQGIARQSLEGIAGAKPRANPP